MMETNEFIKLFKQLDEHRIEVYGEHGEKLLKQYLDINLTPAEITDLARAKEEGRLVVLPCKEGQTIYAIAKCKDVSMQRDDDYFTGTGATECPYESSCDIEDCDDEHVRIFETECTGFWIGKPGEGFETFVEHLEMSILPGDWGKIAFLDKEAAEAEKERSKE